MKKKTTVFFGKSQRHFKYLSIILEYRNSGNYSWLLLLQSKISFNKHFFWVSDPSVCRENAPLVTLSGKCQLILFGQVTYLKKRCLFGNVPSPRRKEGNKQLTKSLRCNIVSVGRMYFTRKLDIPLLRNCVCALLRIQPANYY